MCWTGLKLFCSFWGERRGMKGSLLFKHQLFGRMGGTRFVGGAPHTTHHIHPHPHPLALAHTKTKLLRLSSAQHRTTPQPQNEHHSNSTAQDSSGQLRTAQLGSALPSYHAMYGTASILDEASPHDDECYKDGEMTASCIFAERFMHHPLLFGENLRAGDQQRRIYGIEATGTALSYLSYHP